MAPLFIVLYTAGAVCAFAWIASLVSHDHSWVDRIWSIVPVVYVWIFAGSAGLGNARLDVMAIVVTLWGARLTFNFARKGGYNGVEDYRWALLRGRMPRWQFEIFNLLFIVLYQNAILVLITLPALTAWGNRRTPFGIWDVVVAVVFVGLLVSETVADQQQWKFQTWKKREAEAGHQPDPRFLRTGLWRFSRHPNFFFEQAQWVTLFFFGVAASGSILQWTALGAILLILLFVGSTTFTESITRSKYPEYAEYQATTSPIIPWPPRSSVIRSASATRE
jgi:steroid 5-alpha reductase family enzyme